MSRNNSVVFGLLRKLKNTASQELGPNEYKRFVRKADAVVRELNTKPRNRKRLNKVLAEFLSELLKRDDSADE